MFRVSICFCLFIFLVCFLPVQLLSSAYTRKCKWERQILLTWFGFTEKDWKYILKLFVKWYGYSYRNFQKPLATMCPRFISIGFMEITSLFVCEYKIVFENRYNLGFINNSDQADIHKEIFLKYEITYEIVSKKWMHWWII